MKQDFHIFLFAAFYNKFICGKIFCGIAGFVVCDFFVINRYTALIDIAACVRTAGSKFCFDKQRNQVNRTVRQVIVCNRYRRHISSIACSRE